MKILLETEDQVLVKLSRDEWIAFCRLADECCRVESDPGKKLCSLVSDLQDAMRCLSDSQEMKRIKSDARAGGVRRRPMIRRKSKPSAP